MSVENFVLEASKMNDGLSSVSTGGLLFVLLVWSTFYGLKDDWNLNGFKYPLLLVVPFVLFLVSYVSIQLFFYSALVGFRWEVMQGRWIDALKQAHRISDPNTHFIDQYAFNMQAATAFSLFGVIIAIVLVAGWFVLNVFTIKKVRR